MKSTDKYVFVSGILLLLYRNLFAAMDKMFFIWQVLFPVFQIYIMGYAYSALIGGQGIDVGSSSISYVAFLTTGMMGFCFALRSFCCSIASISAPCIFDSVAFATKTT